MNKIITEITPLSEKDCFYLIDRLKDRFTYPVHRHEEDVQAHVVWWVIRWKHSENMTSCS